VPHVHYHIIPRGSNRVPELSAKAWVMFGRGQRDELDDEDGIQIAASIRKELEKDLQVMAVDDKPARKLLAKW
jgi:diadenosine tetraphosphate (Ap4A) HIT family hydrolase